MTRGDLYWADVPGGRRPVAIVTRSVALEYLAGVVVAPITSTIRAIPSHVPIDERHGVTHESNINCDMLATVRRTDLTEHIGTLDPETLRRLDEALRLALDLEGVTA